MPPVRACARKALCGALCSCLAGMPLTPAARLRWAMPQRAALSWKLTTRRADGAAPEFRHNHVAALGIEGIAEKEHALAEAVGVGFGERCV